MSIFEQDVRRFVSEFSTPNTRQLLAYCEAGTLTWEQAARVAGRALTAAMSDLRAKS